MNAAPETGDTSQEAAGAPGRITSRLGRPSAALIVGPDAEMRRALASDLQLPAGQVLEADSAETALGLLGSSRVGTVLAQDGLDGMSGVDLLERVRNGWPGVRRILVGNASDAGVMCEAINRAGVGVMLPVPWDATSVDRAKREITGASEIVRRCESATVQEATTGHAYGIVGRSPAILGLVDMIERVARTDSPVLITGETGTGKELVGHAIHRASHRSEQVFSAINSAAVPESLLESELFGHRRGAFTGANSNRKGLFEHATLGTVFLDELAEMPLSMQAKLLRFLQTGEIRPIGSETTRRVDVRLVSATNKDLEAEVAAGRFREDLYYRLAVIPITVPPLRERIEDIPLLAEHFLEAALQRTSKRVDGFEVDAMAALTRHTWPGNVRELQNVVERGVALCRGRRITVADLPARTSRSPYIDDTDDIQSLPGLERRHILETLDRVGWNRKKAASLLQISTTTLWRRLKDFGIEGNGPRGGQKQGFPSNG